MPCLCLSKRAGEIVRLAHQAADEYGQGYVGTEHLLLGIVREGTSLAAQILHECGATEYRTKAAVDELIVERVEETWVTGRLPGTPHFIDVFARAERIAERLDQPHICAEHLLAALMTVTGCLGHEALRILGITWENVETAFREQMALT
jgi:ATP-dependent Clp protease ATP-binding subunit ClpC